MKRIILFCAIVASLAMLALGCSGGGGGGGGGGAVAGTFTKTVAPSNGSAWDAPFWDLSAYSHEQHLVLASDINGSGYIRSISLRLDSNTSAVPCPSFAVNMGNTSLAALTDTFASNVQQGKGSLATVRNAALFTVPAGTAGEYFTINFDTPYYYNGVDNLVVEFIAVGACSGTIALDASATANNYVLHTSLNGSATGGLYTEYLNMKFNFAGGDDSIRYTDLGTAGYINSHPFGVSAKVQLLYTAAEINGAGLITSIGFPVATPTRTGTTPSSSSTVTVKLGHTNRTELTDTFTTNFSGTPITVTNARTVTIPAGIPDGAYVWISLPDGAFYYNGTDNLVVQIETSFPSGDIRWICDYNGTKTRLDGNIGDTTVVTGPDNARYFIKFRFAGGTVDVITTENDGLTFPYGTLPNKQQFLYRAAELGTKGSISRIAYRLRLVPTASTYGSFQVVLGQTTNTTLGDTSFSANMTGAQTVYSGTYTIPAGLRAGDWMEIPLSTPFAYDGVSNLVVQTSNLAGVDNQIAAENSATRYPARRAYLSNNTGDDPNASDNILADLRLVMQ
jgi:hypothetical protein